MFAFSCSFANDFMSASVNLTSRSLVVFQPAFDNVCQPSNIMASKWQMAVDRWSSLCLHANFRLLNLVPSRERGQ